MISKYSIANLIRKGVNGSPMNKHLCKCDMDSATENRDISVYDPNDGLVIPDERKEEMGKDKRSYVARYIRNKVGLK